jgi:ABC-type molybdate transport system substrate-binding protein
MKILSRFSPALFLCTQFLAAGALAHADTLTVAVAANAEYVFNDLAAQFKKDSGNDLKPNLLP